MNNWLQEIDNIKIPLHKDFETDYFGFIYKITNLKTGKFYIGKKTFIHNKRKKLGKKAKAALPTKRGRKPSSIVTQVDSGWKEYWGSSKPLLEDIKNLGEDKFERLILCFCRNKKQLSFFEMYYQIKYDVLFINNSYNENIGGRYFRKDFDMSK